MNLNILTENNKLSVLLTFLIGLAGGLVFLSIHMPLPWLLGPMVFVLAGSRLKKIKLYLPTNVRNMGLMIIGYGSGLSFHRETLLQTVRQLPWMLLMTLALIAFSAGIAWLISRLSGIDYLSVFTGSIPGGLTQMLILAEETKGLNLTVITILHVMRLIMVVFCVPLLAYSPIFPAVKSVQRAAVQPDAEPPDVLILKIIIFTVIVLLSAVLAKNLRFPTPFLLGPILAIAVVNLSGFEGPALSPILLDVAQFTIGCYLGLLLKPENVENKVKIFLLSFLYGVVLIAFSFGMSCILVGIHGFEPITGFLCMAPGGADQMSAVASVISADVAMVTGYQLFRMLIVFAVIPPLLNWIYKKIQRNTFNQKNFK